LTTRGKGESRCGPRETVGRGGEEERTAKSVHLAPERRSGSDRVDTGLRVSMRAKRIA
jgi:hypothetical protein